MLSLLGFEFWFGSYLTISLVSFLIFIKGVRDGKLKDFPSVKKMDFSACNGLLLLIEML
jgi:hypothetical protein